MWKMMARRHLKSTAEELILMLTTQEVSNQGPQVTKVVRVPSCEHVAQIIGKSGLKIKWLRKRTNTCIKTPYKGDDPCFIITGDAKSVEMASIAILEASQHFTQLMSSRSNVCGDEEVVELVSVPRQYVGLVVGRNGSTIMKIKEKTNTRINSPKGRDGIQVFEVIGTRGNVLAAREAIMERVKVAPDSTFPLNLSEKKLFDKTIRRPSLPSTAMASKTPMTTYLP